ncbi:MAG: hypothetical protein ABIH23_06445 [bacterium]
MRLSVRHVERFLVGACVFLLMVLYCHLFFRSCGGPFPERVRGPFAKQRYTRLGDLPQEELGLTKDVEIPAN